MPEAPAKAVESPAHEHIEPAPLRVLHECIQGRPAILAPGHTLIDILDCRPAPGGDVLAQFGELVLRFLVERRDAS